jgi:putative intracellular protease/amidase
MFAESGAYNVYTVAASRTLRTLTGGLDVVPHLSFDELADRLHGDPDIVVVPQIVDTRSATNAPVVEWVRRQSRGHALLFSWCTGAEVLAEARLLDGRPATAHWGDLDWLARAYPKVQWQRGVRYVDEGALLTTAGLTAGVDATLHLLARRNVWLSDGVGELDLGAAADVYGVSATNEIRTLATFAARRLEIRTPLRLDGPSAPIRLVLIPLSIGGATLALLFWLQRRSLALGIPPVALSLIAAALMTLVSWVAPARPPLRRKRTDLGDLRAAWRSHLRRRRDLLPPREDHRQSEEAGNGNLWWYRASTDILETPCASDFC